MQRTPKNKRRVFRFMNDINEHGPNRPGPHRWVNGVIDSIERDELLVYDCTDTKALNYVRDDSGSEMLDARLSLPVSIREWPPVGCQCVRWFSYREERNDEASLAFYGHNAGTVLWPDTMCVIPQGPAAFVAEIAIRQEKTSLAVFDQRAEGVFKGILAHELVHVFDMLRLLVPAFMDWRGFWRNVLGAGNGCDVAARRYDYVGQVVDDYGRANEEASILRYWPSQGRQWFKALRGSGEDAPPAHEEPKRKR